MTQNKGKRGVTRRKGKQAVIGRILNTSESMLNNSQNVWNMLVSERSSHSPGILNENEMRESVVKTGSTQ